MATYDPATALLVVDVQNDFADPGGSLYVKGGEKVVEAANAEITRARAAGAIVVYTQDWHPSSTPHFKKDGGIWPVHCVQETWGAEFHRDLTVVQDAPVVRKGTGGEDGYSGFTVADPMTDDRTPTELALVLRERDVSRLVIAGLATDYCVKDTAIDGATLGFPTVVLAGAIAAVNLEPSDGQAALEAMRGAGVAIG
jgi:nicotinamidase/pyrazinamidase